MIAPGAGLSAVAIVGPTAVGKSDVADRLAARLSSEVLSCDAMQIYRGMDIGTAKMAPAECTAPLRLVDIVEPGVAYSARCIRQTLVYMLSACWARAAYRCFAGARACISRPP